MTYSFTSQLDKDEAIKAEKNSHNESKAVREKHIKELEEATITVSA